MTKELLFKQLRSKMNSYSKISDTSWSKIESISKIVRLKKNEILLNHGEIANEIHFVCRGALIASFLDRDGNHYNKNIFMENFFAASTVSCMQKTPSQFILQAIENSTIISIHYERYRELIHTYSDLNNYYIAYLERNWVIEKEEREISIVMETAKERYLKFIDRFPNVIHRISQHHIASHLGITPTQLSRIKKDLE